MTNIAAQAIGDDLQALFSAGTCSGLSDGQLLERFAAGPVESSEQAFLVLVARHGPMVLRVCGSVLDDPRDVHDAFQAVFLVLARRYGAIRRRDSIGSWLYGVALRVAARARVGAIRRRIRECRTTEAAMNRAAHSHAQAGVLCERDECAEILHQEVNRLPERYRAPVVLCYWQGLTHDEAAARLNWPVGTVRSRLARARDTLRGRLARRSLASPSALAPLANWLADVSNWSSPAPSSFSAPSSWIVPRELSKSLARAVSQGAAAQTPAAASVSATALALAQGVLGIMMLKKITFGACLLLPLGMAGLGGGIFLVRNSLAQDKPAVKAAAPSVPQPDAPQGAPKHDEIDELAKQLVDVARKRLDAQRAFYAEGRVTIDRVLDACREFALAQLLTAKDDAQRASIKSRYLEVLREIEKREEAELRIGRGTVADLAEATMVRVRAELELKTGQDLDSLGRRVGELERKVEQLQKERSASAVPKH